VSRLLGAEEVQNGPAEWNTAPLPNKCWIHPHPNIEDTGLLMALTEIPH
jgi:hypothetical protein